MNIHVLGDGVTAKAVTDKINKINRHHIVEIDKADIIVASPGIPPIQYPDTNIEIISEIELAWRLFNEEGDIPKLICITGTNGKTTVTHMISHILDCPIAGNIGIPLISYVPESQGQQAPKYIAVELSSYQLHSTNTLKPNVSIITNITEDHISWHGTYEKYVEAKLKIFSNQDYDDLFIYNCHDQDTIKHLDICRAQTKCFNTNNDEPKIKAVLSLPGDHNLENALCATYACSFLDISTEHIKNKLHSFVGVEHRIEYVSSLKNTKIYNDSKSTNPESTIIAIKALGEKGILILGGRDKNTNLSEMCSLIKKDIDHVILIGEATQRFYEALNDIDYKNITISTTLEEATQVASTKSNSKYILFSPACASFDMYKNFEERGHHFKDIIRKWNKH